MQFFLSILIETIRLDFLLVIATKNTIIFGYALSPLPKGEKIKNWRIPKMNKNVSTQPEKVNDKPIYDLEELLAEVCDMIEERRAIEGIYQEN